MGLLEEVQIKILIIAANLANFKGVRPEFAGNVQNSFQIPCRRQKLYPSKFRGKGKKIDETQIINKPSLRLVQQAFSSLNYASNVFRPFLDPQNQVYGNSAAR